MSKKRWLIVLGALVIAIVVVSFLIYYMALGFQDYWPVEDRFEIEQTDDDLVTYRSPWVGGSDGPLEFDECCFVFKVDNRTIGPTDIAYEGNDYRMFSGAGIVNACVIQDGEVNYIIYIIDADNDGHFSMHDEVLVKSTDPFAEGSCYSLTVIIELESSWSPGFLRGEHYC